MKTTELRFTRTVATGLPSISRTYRCSLADLIGDYIDLRGQTKDNAEIFAVDSYADSQPFGEAVRATSAAGILYPSIRRANGLNIVARYPSGISIFHSV